jgi:hypothetical protein
MVAGTSRGERQVHPGADQPASARELSLQDKYPNLCSCQHSSFPHCKTCNQKFGELDQDLLPDVQSFLSWRAFNRCKTCEGKKPTGNECQVCYGQRRKDAKELSTEELHSNIKSGEFSGDVWKHERRTCALTNHTCLRIAQDKRIQMEEDDKLYRRQYVEGHFSYLDSWLKTNLPEEVLTTTREKIAACNELGITVVRNEEGVLGIEESNLPQGVAYKFQRGHEHSFAKVSMEDFDDEEDSALAIQASGVASNPNVVGEDLGGQMGALLTAGLSHRLRTKSHPPEQQASANNQRSGSPSLPSTVQQRPRTTFSTLGLSQSQPPPPISESKRIPKKNTEHVETPATHEKRFPSGVLSEPVSERSGELTAAKFTNLIRKNMGVPELLQNAQELIAHTLDAFSNKQLWDSKMKKAKIETRTNLLSAFANKVWLAECGLEVSDMGEERRLAKCGLEVSDMSEDLLKRYKFFAGCRDQSLSHIIQHVRVATHKHMVMSVETAMLSNVLTHVGCGAVSKINIEQFQTVKEQVLMIMEFLFYQVDGAFNMSWLTDAPRREKIQEMVLLSLIEKTFKMRVNEFEELWCLIQEKSYIPQVDNCAYCSHHTDHLEAYDQVSYDTGFLSMALEVLRQKRDKIKTSGRFSSMLTNLTALKPHISLRLRTFKGAKHIDGCGDVGRHVWAVVEELESKVEKIDDIGKKGADAWAQIMADYSEFDDKPPSSPEAASEIFLEIFKLDLFPHILNVATALGKQSAFDGDQEAQLCLNGLESWLPAFTTKRSDKKGFNDFFEEIRCGKMLTEASTQSFEFFQEAWQFQDDLEDALHDSRNASAAKVEFRSRLLAFENLIDLDMKIRRWQNGDEADISNCAHVVRLWSDLWKAHQLIISTHIDMPTPRLQTVMETMRSSMIHQSVWAWFAEYFSLNAEQVLDSSALSTAVELQNLLPSDVKKLIEARQGLSHIQAVVDASNTGKQWGILDLCQPLPMMKVIESWPGTSPHTNALLIGFKELLDISIDEWLKSRKYGKFETIFKKLSNAKRGCIEGETKDCPWLVAVKIKDDDAIAVEMREFDSMWKSAAMDNPVASSVLMMMPDSDSHASKTEFMKVAEVTQNILSRDSEIKILMALNMMGNMLLKPLREKNWKADLKKTEDHCKKAYGYKFEHWPKHLQALYEDAVHPGDAASSASTKAPSTTAAALTEDELPKKTEDHRAPELELPKKKKRKLVVTSSK